jgi:PHD/YefM family antitoxin component YafN of YafNO toxin-antitoxin module
MRKSAPARVKAETKQAYGKLVDEVRRADGPVVVKRQGRAAVVALDVKAYRRMLQQVRQLEDLQAIRRGLDAANRGDTRPWAEVRAEIEGKLGLPRRRNRTGRG